MPTLAIPFITKQELRWLKSRRKDVILKRQVTFKERFKALIWGEWQCPHIHRTREAAERCLAAHKAGQP